jgi:hypothetical protein
MIARSLLFILLSCATAQAAPLVRITLTDAELAPKKPGGGTWDEPAKEIPSVMSRLVCAALPGLIARAASCGEGGAVSPSTPHTNPDPFVRVTLGDRVIQTAPFPNSLTPSWRYSFLLDAALLKKGAHITVFDFDGNDASEEIGATDVAATELSRPGAHRLAFGSVRRLGYEVAVVDATQARRESAFDVPSTESMVDLALAGAAPATGAWHPIAISQGDLVEVSAVGQVCPSDVDRKACVGPDGFPKRWLKYNDPSFRTCDHCNHAALVAQLGLESMAIGAHRRFVADTSGMLLLGVNDVTLRGNRGIYHVTVVVNGEPAFAYGGVDTTRDDDASQHAPVSAGALSPALLGATIDKHNDEIASCAQSAPDGTIVLSFAIAGDGSLLGVNVVDAAPALKPIAECIRKVALAWRFPRPQGAMTMKFPLSFSSEP